MADAQDILSFWFGTDPENPLKNSQMWWKKDEGLDREISEKFEKDLRAAASGKYENWRNSPWTCLALVILLDQFSRNIYRDTPKAFTQDEQALLVSLGAIDAQLDQEVPTIQRTFFYLPLMHAENLEMQQRCVTLFQQLADTAPEPFKKTLKNNLDYAIRHAEIIARFGRFPHRNRILGRPSTPEEIDFLKQPGSSF